MAGSIMSTFMMFLPEYTQWFCIIGLAVFVFGIWIPYEEHKKKRKQIKKDHPQKKKPQIRNAAGSSGDWKQLEQLKTLRDAGILTEEEYQERKREKRYP